MAGFGVVHLLKPTGGFVRIEIALPPSATNGSSRPDSLYTWVHEQVVEENVDTDLAKQDPFLLATTNRLDPGTVLPRDAAVAPGTEMYYFRKSLVQHSVKFNSVEPLFFEPPPPSVDTGKPWSAMLYMKRFPHLWSWRRKPSVAGMDPWQPTEVVFRDQKIPSYMNFKQARWLCSPEHMASSVRSEFGTAAGAIEPPENIQMLSTFDYLEWAFEDLFGSWVPSSQRFCPAYPHMFPDHRDPMFDRSSLIARLLNNAPGPAEESLIDGTAVFWMAAGTPEDKRFVTMLRHSHVLPFAPLPRTKTGADPADRDALYAVLQPVDHIATAALHEISLAHAARAACRASKDAAADESSHDQRHKRVGSPGAHRAPPAGSGGDGAAADGQPAKRPRTQEDGTAAPALQERRQAAPASVAKPVNPMNLWQSLVPMGSMLWSLRHGTHKAPQTFETGFLVHVVPLVMIMQAQHARFLPEHVAPPLTFDRPTPLSGLDLRHSYERRRSIVFGCDIDHTLINQAHAVLPRASSAIYPEGFPPWTKDPAGVMAKSDALMHYVMANKKLLHITNFSDSQKSWPESARALKVKGKSENEAMVALIDTIMEHVKRRKAFLIITPDQTFKPPRADDHAFVPGNPYIDEPKYKHMHMNVIFPRRDLAALITACCPLISADPPLEGPPPAPTCFVNYKAVFTTAATQTYADIVIRGMYELVRMWVEYSHEFRKELLLCQAIAFFNGPVLSMAYGRNLGPDPLMEWLVNPTDSGVTKNFAKFLLFGALPNGGTLHSPSWDMTKSAAIILDDSPVAWGPMERPLLLHLQPAKRFKDVEDKMSISDYVHYLANFGADFQVSQEDGVQTDIQTPLGVAAGRMRILFDQCLRLYTVPRPPLDLLLQLTTYHWQEHTIMQQTHAHAMEDAMRKVKQLEQVKAEQGAKIRALESELLKAKAQLSKIRH